MLLKGDENALSFRPLRQFGRNRAWRLRPLPANHDPRACPFESRPLASMTVAIERRFCEITRYAQSSAGLG
jgi:hypothetical protein